MSAERAGKSPGEQPQNAATPQRAATVALGRGLRVACRRAERLCRALEADLARADDAGALRRAGEVLKVQLAAVPSGADRVVLAFPWAPDEAIEVPLQRDLSPRANVERLFRRARGLEQARAEIAARFAAAEVRRAALLELLAQTEALLSAPEADGEPAAPKSGTTVTTLMRAARGLGVRLADAAAIIAPKPRRAPPAKPLPDGVQRFSTAQGVEMLVGRHARANDALVTRLSRGGDVWLHRKDHAGAHGLLRCGGGARRKGAPEPAPPAADLREAAMLVAWLSGVGRDEAADITWTHARHVHKGKGLPAGAVYVRVERVTRVVVDRATIDALYARREAAG